MDSPLDLLFAWVWEHMSCLAPIPRHRLAPAEIPVAYGVIIHGSKIWRDRTQASIRHAINFMEEFVWRPYVGIIIVADPYAHLDVYDTVGPLRSFECVERLPADRVVRQYGYAQSPTN
ncbi:hypothetical protein Ahy_B02g060705 [Arachis hypogaea]|uniref:Aminotransferase-like plant mobile domain-containing protein n=1 Tax=Arachis hypogaea TaxID=3818 RepID=A0A445AJ99_ARAHY|nr:hypothetical protein Ahy_B02g060705 [Arachis hypogaea]